MRSIIIISILVIFSVPAIAWEEKRGMTQLEIWNLENKLYEIQQSQQRAEQDRQSVQRAREARRWEMRRLEREAKVNRPYNSYAPKRYIDLPSVSDFLK